MCVKGCLISFMNCKVFFRQKRFYVDLTLGLIVVTQFLIVTSTQSDI